MLPKNKKYLPKFDRNCKRMFSLCDNLLCNLTLIKTITNKFMSKWIVVSGATKGIGLAIVEKFVTEGFHAIICARHAAELQNTQTALQQLRVGAQVYTYVADMADASQVAAFVEYIKTTTPKVDILVNNAGYFVPGQIHNEASGVLETMIQTNLYSAYNLTRGLVGSMITAGSGHIFNICSIASIAAYPNGGSYSISKFAMYGMSKALREELKPYGIRVTAVLPGATRTASWDSLAHTLPPDRLMYPPDVATMVYATHSLSANANVEDIIIRPQLGDL
jgi:short-subunit dehydrogenase